MADTVESRNRNFTITVLGRTLEHLGTQMYKRRDVALAELVANAWDAGATEVRIDVPPESLYSPTASHISVADNGGGMSEAEVQDNYLVIGRNRRAAGQAAPAERRVMGRKGVGKLAGFGLGRTMRVETVQDDVATNFQLDGATLKADPSKAKTLDVPGQIGPVPADFPFETGTRVTMENLKHKTPVDIDGLHRSLARRFSRVVRGEMTILINGTDLREPEINWETREPQEGATEETLADGGVVTWSAGFSRTVLATELQGFTILVNGKTAQAPPFFFGVEATASGQHGTKYLTGVIEADYLDAGEDDETDRISTDRQEIDWEDEYLAALREWGQKLTRRLLRDRVARREKETEDRVDADPGFSARLRRLDKPSEGQARKFIRALGSSQVEPERVTDLADTIIQAFEYRQFHDYISELDEVVEDAERFQQALEFIRGWKALESRAILEVVKGRIDIVEKFYSLIVNDAPEKAPRVGADNLHDLIATYPWLIHPEWQVLAAEKGVTAQLREWGNNDLSAEDRSRYDFLALEGDGQLVVIEIKRSGHDATVEDLQQLERYVEKLANGHPNIRGVFISGARYALRTQTRKGWDDRDDIDLLEWSQVYVRVAKHYRHYEAILSSELDSDDFARKATEVALTRGVLNQGSYREKGTNNALGPQDAVHQLLPTQPAATGNESDSPTGQRHDQ